jgi:hypothetical protein
VAGGEGANAALSEEKEERRRVNMSRNWPALFVTVLAVLVLTGYSNENPVYYWSFDDTKELEIPWGVEGKGEIIIPGSTREEVSGVDYDIRGLAKYTTGVSGSAMKFDGFSSYVNGGEFKGPWAYGWGKMPKELTIEAWIALGAYPWNWAPIVTVGKFRVTGFFFGVDSSGRLGFHVSDDTAVWHECNSMVDSKTHAGLELKKWHHVAATFDMKTGTAIYINGKLAGTYDEFRGDTRIAYSNMDEGFYLGKNPVDLAPTDPVRTWATYPSRYTFDGIIDEVKIHDGAMTAAQVARLYRSVTPENAPDLPPRNFPSVKPSGRFGANYTRLKFYDEWDALWPVGDHMDVVVQFDEYPTKVMFWRGTRYSPCLVSENGKWMADQSFETVHNWHEVLGPRESMPTGCIEHMSDTQCRSSRVTIIESNDARCVINWRYLQMDVKFRQRNAPNETGFGEWANEYYYIYPDAVSVRRLMPSYGHWQETIFLNAPGTRPEDNVELDAITLVDIDGKSRTYSWAKGYPVFDLEDAIIQMTNLKSKFRPYIIYLEGGEFSVFDIEVRPKYSHFPWWNHWPVSQIHSDGRYANNSDRASHSSLGWGISGGDNDAALYGMTDQPAKTLATLARSWNRPPKMTVRGSAYRPVGYKDDEAYDYSQRAYTLTAEEQGAPLELDFAASDRSPLVNLALVVNNFGDSEVALQVNGHDVPRGKDFRYGIEYDVEGNANLVVFIKKRATRKTSVVLTPIKCSMNCP